MHNIIFCNMEVPHFEIEIWPIWWSVSLVYHFISMPFHKEIWRYHFNSTPFYKVRIGDSIHKFIISYTDILNIIDIAFGEGKIIFFQFCAIFTNFNLMPFQRIGMISFTNFLHFLCSRWSYHLIRSNNLNERKMHEKEALSISPLWVIAHWKYELITHILLHTKRPWGFSSLWTRGMIGHWMYELKAHNLSSKMVVPQFESPWGSWSRFIKFIFFIPIKW